MKSHAKHRSFVYLIAFLAGIGGILYGYDIGVISGALLFIHKTIPMSDTQTGLIVGAVLGGGLLGTLIAGPIADFFGRRIMILISSITFIAGVLCILFADSFAAILIARLLLGVGVGIVAVAVPLYITELVPADIRGKCVTFFQLLLTFGILLAYLVDLAFTPSENWRAMFAVVLIPASILIIATFWLPESPRWLVMKRRIAKAREVLLKTRSASDAEKALARIQENIQKTKISWKHLLKSRKLLIPLLIAVSIAILNQLTGINSFLQYAPAILKMAGLETDLVAMLGSIGIGLLNFICTVIALFLIDTVGRKKLLVIGTTGVVLAEIFLGIVNSLALPPERLGILSMLGLFAFIVFYAIGPGVIVWTAISELFPTSARGKGISLCLFFNSLASTVLASIFLDLKNAIGMNFTYWLFAGFSLIYLFVAIFFLPETKSKTLEEIQDMF
jgi:SP family galactose:H+ symporter-like MFS transporter